MAQLRSTVSNSFPAIEGTADVSCRFLQPGDLAHFRLLRYFTSHRTMNFSGRSSHQYLLTTVRCRNGAGGISSGRWEPLYFSEQGGST
jgi:hypothetical protein